MKIASFELIVVYDFESTLLQLKQGSYDTDPFELSILDEERDRRTGETTVSFHDINELRSCLDDFEKKLKLIHES